VLSRYRERIAAAEVPGVGELVDTGDGAAATDEAVEVVGRVVHPGHAELRDGLTHREAGKLDEGVVDADRTASDSARNRVVGEPKATPIARASVTEPYVVVRRPAEGHIRKGAEHAVLGLGAGVDVEIFTGAPHVAVGEAVFPATREGHVA